ncbi:MerR family transcriptional regulator [Streptomyces noursei]|uniref:MerR family transcriptional regulator n=1 Tax=Streptomyces noursei TaxID=1971 RepID=UPI0023B7BC4F|nr:MerR family transcriptional regulator [Streptomyces noursei]
MRIGELSRETGVAVPTIKFYVREGLLPAGRLTSPNQASYDEGHVRRLRLIRGLIDVGGLSVATVREVLTAVDAPGGSVHDAITPVPIGRPEGLPDARRTVAELIRRRGWRAGADHPAAEAMAVALAAFQDLGQGAFVEVLDEYAEACERVADADLAYVGRHADVEELVESVVVATVLGDAVLSALRRLAHVDRSARRYEERRGGRPAAGDGAGEGATQGGADPS